MKVGISLGWAYIFFTRRHGIQSHSSARKAKLGKTRNISSQENSVACPRNITDHWPGVRRIYIVIYESIDEGHKRCKTYGEIV